MKGQTFSQPFLVYSTKTTRLYAISWYGRILLYKSNILGVAICYLVLRSFVLAFSLLLTEWEIELRQIDLL